MDILVCIKQVPGTTNVEIDPVTGTLKRDGLSSKMNPCDLYALEAALELRERYGGRVRALSMGPAQAAAVLEEAVCMGVDSGVLVSDRRLGGADVLATSRALTQAVRYMGGADLIVCGKQTTDGDTAQVGAEMAELLGRPHACNVTEVSCSGDHITVTVNLDTRVLVQKLPFPCLICMDSAVNTPRLPSYKIKRSLGKDRIETVTMDVFDDRDERRYGLTGSPTRVERTFAPDKKTDRKLLTGAPGDLAEQLSAVLAARKFL